MKFIIVILLFSLLTCCSSSQKNKFDLAEQNRNASLAEIKSFFNLRDIVEVRNIEFFSQDRIIPIKSISVGDYELKRSILYKQNDLSLLILDNPTNTSVNMFIKRNGQLDTEMIENKYYPDSIYFNQLNDTLLVLQYYWKYDFGSDLNNVRTYYFIGKEFGLFKYRYCTINNEGNLKISEPTYLNDFSCLKIADNSQTSILKISPDTLIKTGVNKNSFLGEINLIPFTSLSFSKR
jgi:hypothetical protein